MKLGQLDMTYFRQKFGVDPLERFSEPLKNLTEKGLAELTDTKLTLTRDALLRVDRLLPDFFLPAHRNVRYT